MALTVAELRAVFSADTRDFDRGLNRVDGRVKQTGGFMKQAGATMTGFLGAQVIQSGTRALSSGFGFAKDAAIGFNDQMDRATTGFTTMLGSGKKARTFLDQLKQFAVKTPFEFPELVQNSQKLLAMGFTARDVIPTLTAVGDATAGLGGDPGTMNQIIRALGQMQAKGKVASGEMTQLAEAGVGAWQMLADQIGVSVPEAMRMVEQGSITSAQAIPAIVGGMQGKFGGLMDAQTKTWAGALSNIKDTAVQVIAGVTRKQFEKLRDKAVDVAAWLGEGHIQDALERIGGAMKGERVTKALDRIKGIASSAKDVLGSVGDVVLPLLGDAFKVLAGIALNVVLPGVEKVFGFLAEHKTTVKVLTVLVLLLTGVMVAHATAMGIAAAGGIASWLKQTKLVTAATKAWTAVQWLMNAALAANPIILIVGALVLLGIGLVIAYKKSETFRRIVNGAFSKVKDAAVAVRDWFTGKFVPFFTETLPGAFRATVDWVKRHWKKILVILTGPLGLAVVAIATHWDSITGAFKKAKGWVVGAFATAWAAVRAKIVDPLIAAKDRIVGLFGPGGPIRSAFSKAVEGIGRIWDGLRAAASSPVKFVVETVYNGGIRKVVNAIPGVPDLPAIKYATGGPVTGGDAGRDSVRAWLMPGEHVWTAEEVRRMGGHKAMYALRRAALERRFAKGGAVSVDGEPLTDVAARQLALAESLSGIAMRVIQGSYQPASSYSGTSHTGGGVMDTAPGSWSAQSWLRKVGFAAWARNIPGAAYAGSGAHVHAVSLLDPTAAGHPQARSYLAGGDGLGGPDYGPRPGLLANLSDLLGGIAVGGAGGGGFWSAIKAVKEFASKVVGWVKELAGMGGWGGMIKQMVKGVVDGLRRWINDKVPGPGPVPDLFDSGGWLLPGTPVNRTGRPEAVLTPEESAAFVALAKSYASGEVGRPVQVDVHPSAGMDEQLVGEVAASRLVAKLATMGVR